MLAILAAVLHPVGAHAEGNQEKKEPSNSSDGWAGLPGVTYSPETGLSLSATALYYYRLSPAARFPSRVAISGALSFQGAAELDIDPDVWFDEGRWNAALVTKLSNVKRDFFGIGNDTPDSARESYRSNRFQARLEVARRLPHNLYLAGVYDLRLQEITEAEVGGSIESGAVLGADGGTLSAIGVEFRLDSRDSSFFPTHGIKIESSPRFYLPQIGSDYRMMRWFTDSSAYFSVHPGHVLAFDSKIEIRLGDVPFDFMSDAGGKRLLRGMLSGRLRDKHYVATQVEYRYPIYKRLRGVVFAGMGEVAGKLSQFSVAGIKYSVGGGLRFALKPKEGVYLRVDAGFAEGESGVYLNLLEAF